MTAQTPAHAAHRAYWVTLLRGEEPTAAYDDEEAEYQRAWDASAQAAIGWQRAEDATPTAEDFDHAADIIRLRDEARAALEAETRRIVGERCRLVSAPCEFCEREVASLMALADAAIAPQPAPAEDRLLTETKAYVFDPPGRQWVTASMVQRSVRVGWARAVTMLNQMADDRLIGMPDAKGRYAVPHVPATPGK